MAPHGVAASRLNVIVRGLDLDLVRRNLGLANHAISRSGVHATWYAHVCLGTGICSGKVGGGLLRSNMPLELRAILLVLFNLALMVTGSGSMVSLGLFRVAKLSTTAKPESYGPVSPFLHERSFCEW